MKAFIFAASCLALTLAVPTASADNLVKNAGFEEPKIAGRVTAQKGGTPALQEIETTWAHFQSMDRTGKVIVGLTDEIARSGKQSVYLDFDGAEKTRGAFLMSSLIPVKAGEKYRISIWGRIDAKRPLTLDQGRPFQLLEVEFYPADQASRIGETQFRTQMIPGVADRLLFTSTRWSEYYAEFKSPSGAEFMKVSFRWESPKSEGAASGIIYFDDATVEGAAGNLVPSLDPPEPAEESAAAAGAPAATVPAVPSGSGGAPVK
jgi:hypothetical protein